jgi:hypothetical protein
MPIGEEESIPLFLAELRSPGSVFQRLLWRKQTLKLDESETANDP